MKTKVFKKAAFAVVVTMLLTSNALHGQEIPSIKSHEVEPHFYIFNKPGYIVKSDNDIPLLVKDFIPICKEEFCLSECDDLRLKDYFMPSSSRVAKYQQYYKGYEVEDAIIIVESKEDTVTMITESLVGRLSLDTASPVSQSEALSIAIEALEAIHEVPGWLDSTFVNSYCRNCDGSFDSIRYKVIQPKGKLTVARKFGTEVAAENYRFVWSFHLGTAIKEFRVLVDANTGELFDVTDYTCYLGEFDDSAKVYTLYDSEHYMETYRPSTWQPWTLQNSKGNQTQLNGNPVYDSDNIWDDNVSAPASTAHWIIGELARFYKIEHANFHLTDNVLINAGIGTMVASSYNHLYNRISLGKLGDNWVSTIDIIGHELGHRLNKETANLIHAGESGALEESFADIFGTLGERYIREFYGESWNWTIGEDAQTQRDMAHPSLFSQPETYHGLHWQDTSNPSSANDYGGVHNNCGVPNKWFYNLSQSIGTSKAGHIAYFTLAYLYPNSDFLHALVASVSAAENLYGNCSDERNAVISAWQSVGVSSYNIPLCASSQQEAERFSVDEIYDNNMLLYMEVYPNPASRVVNIEFSDELDEGIIEIYNSTGIKVDEILARNKTVSIGIDHLPNGLYLINAVVNGKSVNNAKVLINN